MRAPILIFLAAGAGLAGECSLDPGAVLHVRVPPSVHLRPGVPLRGVLARPVYCGFQAAFAAATPVEIVPGREQPASGSRKGLRRIFGPRDGVRAIPLRMSRLEPPGRKAVDFRATALSGRWVARPADCRGCLTIRIEEALHFAGLPNPPATAVRIPAGTSARVALLSPVSASRTSADEVVRASLAQPLYIEGNPALPAGTLFEARMLEKVVARRLHRRGRFRLGSALASRESGCRADARSQHRPA